VSLWKSNERKEDLTMGRGFWWVCVFNNFIFIYLVCIFESTRFQVFFYCHYSGVKCFSAAAGERRCHVIPVTFFTLEQSQSFAISGFGLFFKTF